MTCELYSETDSDRNPQTQESPNMKETSTMLTFDDHSRDEFGKGEACACEYERRGLMGPPPHVEDESSAFRQGFNETLKTLILGDDGAPLS